MGGAAGGVRGGGRPGDRGRSRLGAEREGEGLAFSGSRVWIEWIRVGGSLVEVCKIPYTAGGLGWAATRKDNSAGSLVFTAGGILRLSQPISGPLIPGGCEYFPPVVLGVTPGGLWPNRRR